MKKAIIALLLMTLQTVAQPFTEKSSPAGKTGEDILSGFKNPPAGYGEVPFYWWQGDTLTRERISWQLDQLSGKCISSLQINYSHLDTGGLTYGLSRPSKPALFTDAWWDLFRWFSDEANKHGMTVSLSDYTIGVGQGFSMDEAIRDIPELNGSILEHSTYILTGKASCEMPDNLLTLNAYTIGEDSVIVPESRKNMLPFVREGRMSYDFGRSKWKVIAVFPQRVIPSFDPMHPESGKAYNKYFFDRFENALPGKGSARLNFFFSDELNFRLSGNLWDAGFAGEFVRRKGYDIIPSLDALFENTGSLTPKIRLDYNDVIVSLSEENFFKPVYDWHQERGMTFGCDHGGRGRDVTEFGDYFRTQRWNQGPGSDQPNLSKDIVKAKVASSIAHLYKRPRVWLEGFHSSGWGTSSADVTEAIFANFTAGYNLLSFHGLYYSTMGGWWEWAPPCNHFRMPYWKQIDPLMGCVQRLSYLLSQGNHRCDVAVIYPTEPAVADMDGNNSVRLAFEAGKNLYAHGIDFDFIDFESIARSVVKNGEINVSGEVFKVLVIPSMKAIKYSSLLKIEEFRKSGGIVVNIGSIPVATDKSGLLDGETSALVSKLFSDHSGIIRCSEAGDVPSAIKGKYEAGFRILTEIKEQPYVMQRIMGNRNVYVLYNFPKGTRCYFRSVGAVELWDPWDGSVSSLSEYSVADGQGTEVTLPLTPSEIQIIVFDRENNGSEKVLSRRKEIKTVELSKNWEFELQPYLDNRWGDYELPASNELIGARVSQLYLSEDKEFTGEKLVFDESWKKVTCGFGPRFLKLGALPELPPEEWILSLNPEHAGGEMIVAGKGYRWEDYSFSWQYGVEGDYGHQGYHGLKGEMYDNFIRLGATEDYKMSLRRIPEASGNFYILCTSVIAPEDGNYDLLTGVVKPVQLYINNERAGISSRTATLKKGANKVVVIYDHACETYLVFHLPGFQKHDKLPVSMRWYKDYGVLPFNYPSDENRKGLFVFKSAPGLKSISFKAYGKVTVRIDGKVAKTLSGNKDPDLLTEYTATPQNPKPSCSQVAIETEYQPGYHGAAAIPCEIRQTCGKGSIEQGDWSEIDGLRSYSGGAWYRNSFIIDDKKPGVRFEADLGDLVSSAELFINGKSAGIKVSPPWTFDITGSVKEGENRIEVLVYNTLSNHYVSIPTRYRGKIRSGLTGPVKIRVSEP